jgi:hypothetical protein
MTLISILLGDVLSRGSIRPFPNELLEDLSNNFCFRFNNFDPVIVSGLVAKWRLIVIDPPIFITLKLGFLISD